jgi:penicillin-binding protein 1C
VAIGGKITVSLETMQDNKSKKKQSEGQPQKGSIKRWCLFSVLFLPTLLLLLAHHSFPLPSSKLHPKASTVVLDRNGKMLRAFLAPDDMWRIRVSVDDIPSHLEMAVLGYEDQYFYWHFGINPISVIRAAIVDILAGRFIQGASTITMQVARLMEPKERTICNKLIEAFRALQIEWHYSKEEILTLYFNMAPYGGNIVGVGAASHAYFNKSPKQLSLGEAALLAAIPNSPNLLRPDRHSKLAQKARDKVLSILVKQKKITASEKEEALSELIPKRRYALPFMIPHLSTTLKQMYPEKERLETTTNSDIQKLAEKTLRTHLEPWRMREITNGAVVVIENKTQEVLALVGSYDFFDKDHQGQVNGTMALRSPGSALKPFVYALGMEYGKIAPQSLVYDVPIDYSGYQPVNYNKVYHGPVSVEEALIRSLNVPAVNLDAQLGEDSLYYFLKDAGITTLPKPRDYYGLSLVLGGCEVTLLELTNLYAGLANGGQFHPYRFLKSQTKFKGSSLLSPGTCFILTEILSQLRRPDLPSTWRRFINIPKVAWKTGTSYRHRDAWSVGYTPRYTIGVWVGNFDGKGAPALVGAEAAAPILFSLFSAIEKPTEYSWFVQPKDAKRRRVCSISGMRATKHCSATKEELYLPGTSPNKPCSIHKVIWVDKETGKRLYPYCRIGREYEERIVERWPAGIATWLEKNGYPVDTIPEDHPKCTKIAPGEAPIIQSPTSNAEYKIRPGVNLKYQKILLDASVSNQIQTIYWFLDGHLIFSGKPTEKVFIIPTPGAHILICMDGEGRSSETRFIVR